MRASYSPYSLLLVLLTLLYFFFLIESAQSAPKACDFEVRNLSYSLGPLTPSLEERMVLKTKRRYQHSTFKTTVRESSATSSEEIQFQFDLFESFWGSSKESKPLVVLFPTINGVGPLENQMARYLARHGFHVLVPHARVEIFDEAQDAAYQMDLELARAICGVELVVDHRQSLFAFDTQDWAIIGASQGGIRGTTLFNRRSDASALVTSVAASNLPLVYAQSTQTKIESFKFRLLALLGLEQNSELELLLGEQLLIDPSDHADPSRAQQVRMLISLKDTVVPSSAQLQLWEQMGNPERKLLNSGHGGSVLRLHLQRRQVLDFISKQLLK